MRNRTARAAAEGIGTFLLVLIGPGAAAVDRYVGGTVTHVGVSLAFAFVVLAVIYAIGHLSGAHINPAVTLAFWSVGRFRGADVAAYVAAQVGGGVLAALILWALLGDAVEAATTRPAIPSVGALAVELLLSFALMFVIMAVATDERVADGFAGLAVGLTVGFCAIMGGPLTGASMNPARSFGPAIGAGVWDGHWIYWLGPVAGMLVAARTYELLRPAALAPADRAVPPLGVQGPIEAERAAG